MSGDRLLVSDNPMGHQFGPPYGDGEGTSATCGWCGKSEQESGTRCPEAVAVLWDGKGPRAWARRSKWGAR